MTVDALTKSFLPGTTGWAAEDLLDPEIERQWQAGRYEIVEGVLTIMPAAYFPGGKALFNLLFQLKSHLKRESIQASIATEVDLVLGPQRVVIADAILMMPEDERRQEEAARGHRRPPHGLQRILVPPTLVVESISLGHEAHDREIKRRWYAEAHVPHYWLLDSSRRTLECLTLDAMEYRLDLAAREREQLRPSAFPGLVLDLGEVWG